MANSRVTMTFGAKRLSYVAALFALSTIYLALLPSPAQAQAALSITKEGPETVRPGQRFTYTLVVSNNGEGSAENLNVRDELPPGVQYIDPRSSAICEEATKRVVSCAVPNLSAGEDREIRLAVAARPAPGNITNQAVANSSSDPNAPVDSNQVTTRIVPNLTISKRSDPSTVSAEERLIYTLRVENQSSRNISGVRIRDDLPINAVNLISVSSNDFQCENRGDGLILCTTADDLGPNEAGTATIVVEPEEAGTIRNTAEVFVNSRLIDESTVQTKVEGENGSDPDAGSGSSNRRRDDDQETLDLNTNGDDVRGLELDELECEELLREFRSTDGGQYEDTADFATVDVRERVLVCLEREIVKGTGTGDDLPKTGGLPLLGLAALGLASVVVGASVIRGARRDR